MRPAWRLATSSVFERPSRTLLLIAVVALSAVLIAAVGVAMGSLRAAIDRRVEATVGRADVRLKPAGSGGRLDERWLSTVRGWPGVEAASGRVIDSLALRYAKPVWSDTGTGEFVRTVELFGATTMASGIVASEDAAFRAATLLRGRMPTADDEIVIDEPLATRLSHREQTRSLMAPALSLFSGTTGEPMKAGPLPARVASADEARALNDAAGVDVGDQVEVTRLFKPPVRLRVVGVAPAPPLGGRSVSVMTRNGLASLAGQSGRLSEIDIKLRGADPAEFVARHAPELGTGLILQTTERITSGLNRNMRANQLGFIIASLMSFLAAGFIIMTGMSVSITERQRELAILRCIGATRRQLAEAQLWVGAIIGVIGASIGVPIGIAAAAVLITVLKDRIGADVTIDWARVLMAFCGAVFSGVVGASWAAVSASRVSPLKALAVRSRPPRRRTIVLLTAAGLLGVLTHLALFTLVNDGQIIFWAYLLVGLPGLMIGYFLLGVPAVLGASRLLGPVLSVVLRLPREVLRRTIEATPYRFGFTAGAMMAGLALMVAIWTQGGGAVRDWLGRIQFPDAFVVGLNLTSASQRALDDLPFVTETCAVAMHPVETEVFGIRGLTRFKSMFVAFEPEPFFRMARLDWVQGDPATAARRLEEGGAVIVAREFYSARKLGVGDTFVCWDNGVEHRFEIVGVVTSPGLEMVSKFFQVGEEFTDQSVHAVFGSRRDLRERFGSDAIGMIQMTLSQDVSDDEAMRTVRERLFGSGIIDAGSGRQIKQDITRFVGNTLLVSSLVAVFAMLVACLGVANLIVAGVRARQFEFGVLRAVGAHRGLLTRLVLGEALIIALAACVLGTLMGVQGGYGGIRLNALIWGVEISLRPPVAAIAAGWGFVIVMTLGAAAPAVAQLGRKTPRELLGAMRG